MDVLLLQPRFVLADDVQVEIFDADGMQVVRDVMRARQRWGEEIEALHGSPDRKTFDYKAQDLVISDKSFRVWRGGSAQIQFRTGILALEEKRREPGEVPMRFDA
jgi:hypothetical protein